MPKQARSTLLAKANHVVLLSKSYQGFMVPKANQNGDNENSY